MSRISAAEHHLIEYDETVWALLSFVESGEETVLFEARPEEPLQYSAAFAMSRRLPNTRSLPLDYVWQVVLGWSYEDDAWHLGLLLSSDIADARGSRWCELVYWPDPDPAVFAELAEKAAKGLAMVLACPLNIISPAQAIPQVRRAAQTPTLLSLPVVLGDWSLERNKRGYLQLVRSAKWLRERWLKISWYAFWLVIYTLLSVATLTSSLALPNAGSLLPEPAVLPYLGLGVAAILVGMIIYNFVLIRRSPDRFVIDGEKHRIIALHGKDRVWYRNGNDMQSIYVTQVVNRHGNPHTVYETALNLYLNEGDFLPLVHVEKKQVFQDVARTNGESLEESVEPLTADEVQTNGQAAALTIAQELGGLPCYYDRRTR